MMLSRRHALGVGAAAIGIGVTRSARAAAGQVIVGMTQEITHLHPLSPGSNVDQGFAWLVFNPLWNVVADGSFVPQLATEIPSVANGGVSADGLHWRVKLRDDVRWHDGETFSAEDVKFTLELMNDNSFQSSGRAGHTLLRDIKVVSPTEITWRLDQPYASYAAILSWTFIVPRHILQGVPNQNSNVMFSKPVGTGPFRMGDRVAGNTLTLHANADYFGRKTTIQQVVFKYVPDQTVLYTQFQTGEVDYVTDVGLPTDRFAAARKLPGRWAEAGPTASIEVIAFNLGMPHFQDPAVRQALYLATDKATLVSAVYEGVWKPADSYLPPESWGHNPKIKPHVYDVKQAAAVLDAAGWKPGGDGVRAKDGLRLEFTNSTTAAAPQRELTQQVLQQSWASIGAKMNISNMPSAVLFGDFLRNSKFDSMLVGWNSMSGPDPDAAIRFATDSIQAKGGAGQNYMQYSNPVVDKLFAVGGASQDQAARQAAYFKIQDILRDDLPILPLFQRFATEGGKAGLKGYQNNLNTRTNFWNLYDWNWAA
jgi:peptide/nickel transport system substrate-binding protein